MIILDEFLKTCIGCVNVYSAQRKVEVLMTNLDICNACGGAWRYSAGVCASVYKECLTEAEAVPLFKAQQLIQQFHAGTEEVQK